MNVLRPGQYVRFERRIKPPRPYPFEIYESAYGIVCGAPASGTRVRIKALDTNKRHVIARANVKPVSFEEAHA